MKTLTNVIIIAFSTSLVLASCNKKNAITATTPKEEVKQSVSSVNVSRGSGITLTLAFFKEQASLYGYSLELAPTNYVPTKLDQWNYSKVYLYSQSSNETTELYEFDNDIDRNIAVAGNNLDYWQNGNKMECSGSGSLCGDTGNGTPVIALQ